MEWKMGDWALASGDTKKNPLTGSLLSKIIDTAQNIYGEFLNISKSYRRPDSKFTEEKYVKGKDKELKTESNQYFTGLSSVQRLVYSLWHSLRLNCHIDFSIARHLQQEIKHKKYVFSKLVIEKAILSVVLGGMSRTQNPIPRAYLCHGLSM